MRDIQAVIAECYGFEFYVIQQQFHWLVCENHHNVVVAVGADSATRYFLTLELGDSTARELSLFVSIDWDDATCYETSNPNNQPASLNRYDKRNPDYSAR